MVFGSGNKFRIRRSQSKASYLASRRDRERIVPDSDTGSYKRTISPNGHVITSESYAETRINSSRETVWPLNRTHPKETTILKNNNNANILRRASMNDKSLKIDEKEQDLKKPQLALPDVLPVNAKLINPRYHSRPSHLSLAPIDHHGEDFKKSPHSPPKSPFTPLRHTNLSSPPISEIHCETPKIHKRISPDMKTPSPKLQTPSPKLKTPSPKLKTPSPKLQTPSPKLQSPEEPKSFTPELRLSDTYKLLQQQLPEQIEVPRPPETKPPQIKPSLSPTSKTSRRTSPLSTASSTPLKTSPLSSPSLSPVSPVRSPVESPPASPKHQQHPKVIEGLQLMQRTEVVLRVNACTTDASSQTEKEEMPPTPLPTRKKLQEEIDCEKLSEDFVSQLPTADRLKDILVQGPDHKKPTDYVTGLFRLEVTSRPRNANSPFSRSRANTPSSSPPPTSNILSTIKSESTSAVPTIEPVSPLSATSPYFTTSEPKARFLTRYSQDMNHLNVVKDTKDLSQKKEELVSRLDRKLEVLRGEQLVVSEECRINDELGENVENHVGKQARPHETAKFRLHVEEVGKITSLLLGLSGRLARAENALMTMPEDHPERRILESKRDKLLEQLEEAKKLKESIDKRSLSVSNILYKYLNSEEYADYDHFINMKAKLIMDSKEIADKIKLGEEQLVALKETLIIAES
ncbi:PREDICTED: protein Shroom-like isoform X2 [Nicrophorus vespilloides]|uniref:Protein Shroom-like isoform X2 n=1 Tax=Nicrophorus vespilloides TaxID=110193 RepID=A0ABM1M671_NICVS|nr:PREDICTED: protein Shroom-like isoform X2 [Nicrophorus vespilloides]